MPLPVISTVYRVALIWGHTSGQNAVNVIHVRRISSTPAAVAVIVDANVTANMWAQVVNGASVNRLDVTPLDGGGATSSMAVSGAKWTGSAGAVDFVPQAAEVISFKTAVRGRSYRGRIYIPFIGESAISNGAMVGTGAAQTAWTNFVAALGTATTPLVVASYQRALYTDVTTATVKPLAGTERRRQSRLW